MTFFIFTIKNHAFKLAEIRLLLLCIILLGLGCNINSNQRKIQRNYATINGIKMYYEISGKGFPLLVIHGNGGEIHEMSNQIRYFENQFQVIAMDCRGRGNSELGIDTLSYQLLTEDIYGLIKHLNLNKVNILGYSDG